MPLFCGYAALKTCDKNNMHTLAFTWDSVINYSTSCIYLTTRSP